MHFTGIQLFHLLYLKLGRKSRARKLATCCRFMDLENASPTELRANSAWLCLVISPF